MKNLKIISIFIILIFCLSPLSAMDLNDRNNTTNSSQMAEAKTIEVESINIANNTSDEKSLKKNTASIANEKNETKISEELMDPDISVLASDIYLGEKPTIFINANYKFNCSYMQVKIDNSGTSYTIKVENGFGYKTIDKDLPLGKYTVTAWFLGNDKFKPQEATTTFYVLEKEIVPVDPKLHVGANPITVGETANVEIRANESLNGHVKVKLNISKYDYDVEVKNGYGKIEFANLPIGNYTIKATYDGDDTFKAAEDTSYFEVRKEKELIDPNLSINVNDVNEGEKIFAEIHTDDRYTGYASIQLDNQTWRTSVRIENGYGNVTLSDKLSPGEHTATAIFYETPIYSSSKKTTIFKVN